MSEQQWEDVLAATADMDAMTQAGLLGRIAWHVTQRGPLTVEDFLTLAGRERERAERLPTLDLNQRPGDSPGDERVNSRRGPSSPAGLQAIKDRVVVRGPGDEPTLPA